MVLPQVSGGALDTVAEKREEVLVQDEVAAMDCNGSPPGSPGISIISPRYQIEPAMLC